MRSSAAAMCTPMPLLQVKCFSNFVGRTTPLQDAFKLLRTMTLHVKDEARWLHPLIMLSAAPGVGKTRWLQEFAESASQELGDVIVVPISFNGHMEYTGPSVTPEQDIAIRILFSVFVGTNNPLQWKAFRDGVLVPAHIQVLEHTLEFVLRASGRSRVALLVDELAKSVSEVEGRNRLHASISAMNRSRSKAHAVLSSALRQNSHLKGQPRDASTYSRRCARSSAVYSL